MYIKAKVTNEIFKVWGSFYNLEANDQTFTFRNALDIANKEIAQKELLEDKLDALVVMLNPGSSKPLDPSKIQNKRGVELTLSKPDTAQYQVMSLMYHQNWNHVRILNLSDLREPKSQLFFNTLQSIDSVFKKDDHSIFCSQRSKEFNSLYNLKENANTILGWTLNPCIQSLAAMALSKGFQNIVGIGDQYNELLFRYPSPQNFKFKEEWLKDIIKMIA
jgi:hypothetical protein